LLSTLVFALGSDTPLEWTARVSVRDEFDVSTLARAGLSLEHPKRGHPTVDVILPNQDLPILDSLGLSYTLLRPQLSHNDKRALSGYHNYDALTAFLQDVSSRCANITNLFSLGKSVQDRDLWCIEFSSNPGTNEAEPEFKYVGNMHGDEVVGREMLLNFVDLLCTNYRKDSSDLSQRVTKLVDNTDIFIVPTMNPDGFELRTRGNANGKDLNRDFPDQFNSPSNTPNGRQVETKAMMSFVSSHHFVMSANYHGGSLVANYPYDGNANFQSGRYTAAPDDHVFKDISLAYSMAHRKMHLSQEFTNGITNGAEWYVLYGGMQDWNYIWGNSCLEITLEISDIKWPDAGTLPGFWDDNREAMLQYMELTYKLGIRGRVTSAQNNQPLDATIRVDGINHDITTDPEHGDYYRLLAPATYQVTASATGYSSKSTTVTVPQGQTTQVVVNFAL